MPSFSSQDWVLPQIPLYFLCIILFYTENIHTLLFFILLSNKALSKELYNTKLYKLLPNKLWKLLKIIMWCVYCIQTRNSYMWFFLTMKDVVLHQTPVKPFAVGHMRKPTLPYPHLKITAEWEILPTYWSIAVSQTVFIHYYFIYSCIVFSLNPF